MSLHNKKKKSKMCFFNKSHFKRVTFWGLGLTGRVFSKKGKITRETDGEFSESAIASGLKIPAH